MTMITVFFVVIRLRFRFWATQPVFHVYDLQYYLFPPGIIYPTLPDKTKFYDPDIEHLPIDDPSSETNPDMMHQLARFIRTNYLQTPAVQFCPTVDNVAPYFSSHANKSYISVKWGTELIANAKTNKIIVRPKPISSMTTRPVVCEISKLEPFECNYVDYLCVADTDRGKGLAAHMIYTHAYHTRRKNNKVIVSLFKREDNLTGIVPMCVYDTIGFDMHRWKYIAPMPPNMGSVVECVPSTVYQLIDFITTTKGQFEMYASVSPGNLTELVRTKNIYVYMLLSTGGEIMGAYFFRNTCTWHKDRAKVLGLFASINRNAAASPDLFSYAFKLATSDIVQKNPEYTYIVIESLSNNDIIIENLKQRTTVSSRSPTAYFFYNFAYHTFQSNKVIVIN